MSIGSYHGLIRTTRNSSVELKTGIPAMEWNSLRYVVSLIRHLLSQIYYFLFSNPYSNCIFVQKINNWKRLWNN